MELLVNLTSIAGRRKRENNCQSGELLDNAVRLYYNMSQHFTKIHQIFVIIYFIIFTT